MGRIADFFGNNNIVINAEEVEKALREEDPLILHEDEKIELAYQSGRDSRDKSLLTSHRVLLKESKNLLSNQRKRYTSIPYKSIKSFSIETAGGIFDGDTTLKIWSTCQPSDLEYYTKIDFGSTVDIFSIQQYFNEKILSSIQEGKDDKEDEVDGTSKSWNWTGMIDWFGDNMKQFDPEEVENKFKNEFPVLLNDEKVQLAFKCGRDFQIYTSKRFFIVDVQGLVAKKMEFRTLLWSTLSGISVQSAGHFLDRDTEIIMYTNIDGLPAFKQDFSKSGANLFEIHKCLSNHLLNNQDEGDTGDDKIPTDIETSEQGGYWWFFGKDNNRPLDPNQMNEVYHKNPALLKTSETVEMAFKGIRDVILLTNKRLLKIDPKGVTGKRTEYTSIPWKSIAGFAIRTAGKHVDMDTEVVIWTDMMFTPAYSYTNDDGEEIQVPKSPGMSMWELDFNKKMVNIHALKKYLSYRVIMRGTTKADGVMNVPVNTDHQEEGWISSMVSWFGDDQRVQDPQKMNEMLHTEVPILLEDETVVMSFKAKYDGTLFTNLRVIFMDVQFDKRVFYKSIPYTSLQGYSIQTAGSGFDRDTEMFLYTCNVWDLGKVQQDFKKDKANMIQIQHFLSAMVLKSPTDAAKYLELKDNADYHKSNVAGIGCLMSYLTDTTKEIIETTEINEQLHTKPPLLLEEENCEKVYRCGRDYFIYTNKRMLFIDVQGFLGKKVDYLSIPLDDVARFEVETSGLLDRDSEIHIFTDMPEKLMIKQDLLKRSGNVMEMHNYLTTKLMFS